MTSPHSPHPDLETPHASQHELRAALLRWLSEREDALIKLRRRLHATPEASGFEHATSALVAEKLRDHGLSPRIMQDGIGVVADLDLGAPADRIIALRAELDCVRVNDDKTVPYASTHPGLCHACGHDVHMTCLLGAAMATAEHREQIAALGCAHNLRVIFQPAEEIAVGARSMIKQGALDSVSAIIAVHVEPFIDAGVIGLRNGALTSGAKGFEITLRGRSGHSARPHEAIDPVLAAANLVSLLYQHCPRVIDSRHAVVVTVASIQSGAVSNAIPDTAHISGTLRGTQLEDMQIVQRTMERIIEAVRIASGVEAAVQYSYHAPPTDNDPRIIELLARSAEGIVGAENVQWIPLPSLGAEDFAFYQELIPGAIVRLGTGFRDGRLRSPLHSSTFDVDETAILRGAAFLTWSAVTLARSFEIDAL